MLSLIFVQVFRWCVMVNIHYSLDFFILLQLIPSVSLIRLQESL